MLSGCLPFTAYIVSFVTWFQLDAELLILTVRTPGALEPGTMQQDTSTKLQLIEGNNQCH